MVIALLKLVSDSKQFDILMGTLTAMNLACNQILAVAFDNQRFNRTKLHKLTYHLSCPGIALYKTLGLCVI